MSGLGLIGGPDVRVAHSDKHLETYEVSKKNLCTLVFMVSGIFMDESVRPFCWSFLVSPNPQIDTGYLTHAKNPKTRNLHHFVSDHTGEVLAR